MPLLLLLLISVTAPAQVKVWQDTLTLPTDEDALPDANPPFDQFQAQGPFYYPYTARTNFTTRKAPQNWRALNLENEFLHCIILPDLGGHVYTCYDKIANRDMFYANSAIRKQWVGLRGAWSAFGLESNFPFGHSWVSISPIDFATRSNPDGSASVWVGNVDRVTGMQWRAEFVLRPGMAALEQNVTLENRSLVRHRYYWWANAGVRLLSKQDRFILPANAIDTGESLDTWPIGTNGKDLSVLSSYTDGAGFFAVGSNEDFFAVYQPTVRAGLVHVAKASDVPGKKTWNWGPNTWSNENLSADGSTYIEIQGGATASQESFDYLEPQQIRTFTEYWIPARSLSGISKASSSAVISVSRKDGALVTEVMATRNLTDVTVRISSGGQTLLEATTSIYPVETASFQLPQAPAGNVTFSILDEAGKLLITYTEQNIDATPANTFTIGKKPTPTWLNEQKSEADFLSLADYYERNANFDAVLTTTAQGLKLFPASQQLFKTQGRIQQILNNPEAAASLAKASNDSEARYYRALATDDAAALSALKDDPQFGVAATIRAAEILAASGDSEAALASIPPTSRAVRVGAVELALLRELGRSEEAATRLEYWLSIDPTDLLLRYEAIAQGAEDSSFWHHLAADAERVLNVAEHLMRLGQFTEALIPLEFDYATVPAIEAEPGVPLPSQHALLWYYRAYCRQKTSNSGADEFRKAPSLPLRFNFASRPYALEVLAAALRFNSSDPSALWLQGSIFLHMRRTDDAIAAWDRLRTLRPTIPSLHRSLGRVWLDIKKDKAKALPILTEGLRYEPENADLQNAFNRAR